MFTVAERDRVRERVLTMAAADSRVVAGALVGGTAGGGGDRWSDLDLTFGVVDRVPVAEVLGDWTCDLARELEAVHLFDLPRGSAIYRVFLLPGCLQVDLSFAPASEFGARGPRFTLLFGSAVELAQGPRPSAHNLFGLGVHHALRARFCIERDRLWHAEYWISAARDEALALACRRHGLETAHGRGFDDLPSEVLVCFRAALVRSLDREDLLHALGCVIEALLQEADETRDVADKVEARLRELTSATLS